jgi:hypothetical protein
MGLRRGHVSVAFDSFALQNISLLSEKHRSERDVKMGFRKRKF